MYGGCGSVLGDRTCLIGTSACKQLFGYIARKPCQGSAVGWYAT
jgi:hypothetical protein